MSSGFQLAIESAPFLLKGALFSIELSLGGMFFGLVIGFGIALMRLSQNRALTWIARSKYPPAKPGALAC